MKKVVFITGSTRGIGKSSALMFARKGYTVIANGRKRNADSEKLLQELKQISPASTICYFDVANKDQVTTHCRKIIQDFPQVDILINNAGISQDRSFLKMTNSEWDHVIKTILYGTFNITKEIIPLMIKQNWGRVINIASVIAITGSFGQVNYASAKAGLLGFTKSLAKEMARYNITVNAVCPGFTATDMIKKIPAEIMEKNILPKIPMRRMAQPDEISELLLFLASEKSSYMTGSCININGGFL